MSQWFWRFSAMAFVVNGAFAAPGKSLSIVSSETPAAKRQWRRSQLCEKIGGLRCDR